MLVLTGTRQCAVVVHDPECSCVPPEPPHPYPPSPFPYACPAANQIGIQRTIVSLVTLQAADGSCSPCRDPAAFLLHAVLRVSVDSHVGIGLLRRRRESTLLSLLVVLLVDRVFCQPLRVSGPLLQTVLLRVLPQATVLPAHGLEVPLAIALFQLLEASVQRLGEDAECLGRHDTAVRLLFGAVF